MRVIILFTLVLGVVVGAFGSMLGIGGGALLIPLLTIFMGVPIRTAVGTSIICVIATSSAVGAAHSRQGLAHNKLAITLEVATAAGALCGGITAMLITPRALSILFGVILLYMFFNMRKLPKEEKTIEATGVLETSYFDLLKESRVHYGVRNLGWGMGASFIAGNVSGLLGIGGGIIKVPIMSLVMGVPLRAAIATSNFMIGITAATSAMIYFSRGYVSPKLAIPTALGVLAGAQIGARVGSRLRNSRLKQVFQLILLAFAFLMFIQASRG